jgi:two-component system, NtrC family, sensor kinase
MQAQGVSQRGHTLVATLEKHVTWPTLTVWGIMLLIALVVGLIIGTPKVTPLFLIGAALIAILLAIGELIAVPLGDGSLLTPAPALLIAGLSMTSWPLLIVAVVIGTIAPAVLRRRLRRAIAEAGGRALSIALVFPIIRLASSDNTLLLNTLPGLIALPMIGAIVYLVEMAVATFDSTGAWNERLLAKVRIMRWYVLATVPIGGMLGHLWQIGPLAFIPGLFSLGFTQYLFRAQVALSRTTDQLEVLAAQHKARGERLEKLQALSTAMIGTLDLHVMLQILCGRLAALMDAPYGWAVLSEKDTSLTMMANHNLPLEGNFEDQTFVNPDSYYGVMRRGRVVLMTDEYRTNLAPVSMQHVAELWDTVLSIPLVTEKRVLGVICLAFKQLRGIDAEEQRVLAAFANQAAITIENARLFDELRHKQVELIQSSKLAAVGTFASGIAHEFNNLLGSMLGHAELGHSADEIEEKDHSLEVISQACRRGRSITRGLLTFARRQEHQRTLADITDAIHETLMLVELDLRKSRITVVRQIEPVSLTYCDLGQLSQVVLNFITNARDAMGTTGGTLTIALRERQSQIELSVSDTGSGIPAELLEKIFEPFVTTKGSLGGSQTPGTGLGLSVSYGIVKEHGGTILVESEVGRGTTMLVRMPILTEPPVREEG